MESTPLAALSYQTLESLSARLNTTKLLKSIEGHLRDWRGLAEYAQLTPDDCLKLETAPVSDRTNQLISIWCRRGTTTTISDLVLGLKLIDRFDIINDLETAFLRDCEGAARLRISFEIDQKINVLTLDDMTAISLGKELPTYDAMGLFAQTDTAFAFHVINRLERAGLRIFVPERDLIAGAVSQEASSEIVAARCARVLAFFSTSFFDSKENVFLINFAQFVGVQESCHKIIPVIYRQCQAPLQLRQIHAVIYDENRPYFWSKLFKSFGVLSTKPELYHYSFDGTLPSDNAKLDRGLFSELPPSKTDSLLSLNPDHGLFSETLPSKTDSLSSLDPPLIEKSVSPDVIRKKKFKIKWLKRKKKPRNTLN